MIPTARSRAPRAVPPPPAPAAPTRLLSHHRPLLRAEHLRTRSTHAASAPPPSELGSPTASVADPAASTWDPSQEPSTSGQGAPLSGSASSVPRRICIFVEPSPFTYVSGYKNRFTTMIKYLVESHASSSRASGAAALLAAATLAFTAMPALDPAAVLLGPAFADEEVSEAQLTPYERRQLEFQRRRDVLRQAREQAEARSGGEAAVAASAEADAKVEAANGAEPPGGGRCLVAEPEPGHGDNHDDDIIINNYLYRSRIGMRAREEVGKWDWRAATRHLLNVQYPMAVAAAAAAYGKALGDIAQKALVQQQQQQALTPRVV
ncbi:hypothetical protein TSOC_007321 [Tetrabaena socialis]|uniref:Uncharacterized protein n=1 Tax=Tetrabaena socialis TaxID=47790 RepID=A0A2J8A1A2_9CHLO|nr:hypothetical protein TSOC_007321 [Tetrabaena socialis]|eukprot:PNH06301.1 hypothetical protein TSOC_007321 [Tetrabaena socialis]